MVKKETIDKKSTTFKGWRDYVDWKIYIILASLLVVFIGFIISYNNGGSADVIINEQQVMEEMQQQNVEVINTQINAQNITAQSLNDVNAAITKFIPIFVALTMLVAVTYQVIQSIY